MVVLKYAGFLRAPQGRKKNACSHHTSHSEYSQDFLLGVATSTPEPSPLLHFQSVPADVSLGTERFFLTVLQGDRRWRYPIQFAGWEAELLANHVCRWDWRLDDGGIPVALEQLHSRMKCVVNCLLLPSVGGAL